MEADWPARPSGRNEFYVWLAEHVKRMAFSTGMHKIY